MPGATAGLAASDQLAPAEQLNSLTQCPLDMGKVPLKGLINVKSRILTGLIGSAVALIVLLLLPPLALNIAMSIICAMAMYEVFVVTKLVSHRGLETVAVLFALTAPFLNRMRSLAAVMVILGFLIALAVIQVRYHSQLPVEKTGLVFMISVLISVSFSCLVYLRETTLRGDDRDGLFYVFLGLAIPWLCDIGAYFVGTFLGRHKLCPTISPKKTVEGLVGGICISVGSGLLAGYLYQVLALGDSASVNLWQIGLLSLLCAPLSVLGDLFASVIKRQSGAKDFGHIMPGHGGIMDRFDSMMFVLPVIYIAIRFFPLVY